MMFNVFNVKVEDLQLKVLVGSSILQAMKALRESRDIALLCF
jgi:hypothetical protein